MLGLGMDNRNLDCHRLGSIRTRDNSSLDSEMDNKLVGKKDSTGKVANTSSNFLRKSLRKVAENSSLRDVDCTTLKDCCNLAKG